VAEIPKDRIGFLSSCSRVFAVNLKALSSNCMVLSASDVRGLLVKLYLPRFL
jgi:hypothetical protein